MTILPVGKPHNRAELPVYPVVVEERPDKYSIGDTVEVVFSEDSGGGVSGNEPGGVVDHDATIINISRAESINAMPDLLLAFNAESRSASDAKSRVKDRSNSGPYYILFLMREDRTKEFVVNGLDTIKQLED